MILCRQNKHAFVLFTLENIPVSPHALRPLARDYKYSAGRPNWFSQSGVAVESMSEREARETCGIFRTRWIKVCGAIRKTAAELGLSPSDEEDIANVLVMSPPKSAGRRGTGSPSPPKTPPSSTRARSPTAGTSTAFPPPGAASFSPPPTGIDTKSTSGPPPLEDKFKVERDINNNAGVAARSEDPPEVSQICHTKTLLRRFLRTSATTFF